MLDLKAKLLAAGLVTSDQVKKVEDEEAVRKQQARDRRDAEKKRREEPGSRADGRPGDRGPRGPGGSERGERGPRRHGFGSGSGTAPGGGPRGGPRSGPGPGGERGPRREGHNGEPRSDGPPGAEGVLQSSAPVRKEPRDWREKKKDEADARRARREHEWDEALRWRQRVDALKSAGKSEQYEAVRGWVMRLRLDNSKISDAAVRFHFPKYDRTIGFLTVEPDVQAKLASGEAAVVAFIGYNGVEHAAVSRDVAVDIHTVKPEWLRHLLGITDVTEPLFAPEQVDPPAADAGSADPAAAVADAASADASPPAASPPAASPPEAPTAPAAGTDG